MIDNKAIRRRAWELFAQNWLKLGGMLLLGFGVPVVLMCLGMLGVMTPAFFGRYNTEVGSVIGVGVFLLFYLLMLLMVFLWYPPLMMGLCRIGLRTWRGYPLEWRDLFYYLSDIHRLLRVYGKMFLLGVLLMGALTAGYIAIMMVAVVGIFVGVPLTMLLGSAATVLMGIFVFLLFFVAYGALIWMELRFALVLYVMVEDDAGWPIEALKTSWRATRRNVKRLLGMALMLVWPIMVAMVAVLLPAFFFGLSGVIVTMVSYLLMLVAYGVYAGYMLLAFSGLAAELLGALPQNPRAAVAQPQPQPRPQVQWSSIPDEPAPAPAPAPLPAPQGPDSGSMPAQSPDSGSMPAQSSNTGVTPAEQT